MSATTFAIWNTALPAVVIGHRRRERQLYVNSGPSTLRPSSVGSVERDRAPDPETSEWATHLSSGASLRVKSVGTGGRQNAVIGATRNNIRGRARIRAASHIGIESHRPSR